MTDFITNLKIFQWETKAKITKVSYHQETAWQLRNEMSHANFNNRIWQLINDKEATGQHQALDNCRRSLAESTPTASPPPKPKDVKSKTECKVVPGVLTYCEASKQSKSVLSVSDAVQNPPLPYPVPLHSNVAPNLNSQQSGSTNQT